MSHLKKVILDGLFFIIIAFALSLSFTSTAEAGPCNRILDRGSWECSGTGGNCCDDVVVYG